MLRNKTSSKNFDEVNILVEDSSLMAQNKNKRQTVELKVSIELPTRLNERIH